MGDAPSVVLVGAGGHASVVAEAVGRNSIRGYLSPTEVIDSHDRLGPWLGDDGQVAVLEADGCWFAVAIGFVDRTGALRRRALVDGLAGRPLQSVVHAHACVSPTAAIGEGAFVAAAAAVGSGASIGRTAIVNTGAVVDHDCRVGANVHIGPGVTVSGDVAIGDHTLVGVGATIRQGVRIGSEAVVGAGAVVISDIPDGATALGVPARIADRPT